MGDRSQRDDHGARTARPETPAPGNDCSCRTSAGSGLLPGGRHFTALVIRQSPETQAVVAASDSARVAKPMRVQGAVQQDAGVIAGERPAGAIGAVHPRRETDDEQPVARAAEGRHRPAVISRDAATGLHRGSAQAAGRAGNAGSNGASLHARPERSARLELRLFGRAAHRRDRRGPRRDRLRHVVEVAGADFALMLGRGIARGSAANSACCRAT